MLSTEDYNKAVKEYSKNIFRFIIKSVKDEAWSKDIVQDCYLKLWQHRDNVPLIKIKPWLFTTAHNLMINQIKRGARTVSIESEGIVEPHFMDPDYSIKELIDKCLDKLPLLQKNILLLRDLEGYNYKEIGQMLSLTEEQVKVYLFRARQKIKNSLKELNTIL
jgi:RNA polymerase sigma-70 factor, ECF subfamily